MLTVDYSLTSFAVERALTFTERITERAGPPSYSGAPQLAAFIDEADVMGAEARFPRAPPIFASGVHSLSRLP